MNRSRNWHPACQTSTTGPAISCNSSAAAGLLGWGLPEEFGGHPVSDSDMLAAYEMMAAACLTTTFVLTQRNAACQRIASSDNAEIKSELLPPFAPENRLPRSASRI